MGISLILPIPSIFINLKNLFMEIHGYKVNGETEEMLDSIDIYGIDEVGSIDEHGNVELGETMDGYMFHSMKNFLESPTKICYIPELCSCGNININDNISKYSFEDLLKIAKGNIDGAIKLFLELEWEHPETLWLEYEDSFTN